LEDVGQTHRLEVILRVAGLPINFDDIPTDDELEIAPEPRSMHFTDADWYSFYDSGLSFTDMLVRGGDAGLSTFQPFIQSYPIWTDYFLAIHTELPSYTGYSAIWTIVLSAC
jgi:hypothetical protein